MTEQVFPTKGNLLNVKKSLQLSQLGYELLDRKRNILIRELMTMIEDVKSIRGKIEETYKDAYEALQYANITLGIINNVANSVPIEKGLKVHYRSVMGVELPTVSLEKTNIKLNYGFYTTNFQLDHAYKCFDEVKSLTIILAQVENGIYRLAISIKKTQSRANALKNIMIPKFQENVKYITNSLEEKEREEFSRLKVIKTKQSREKEQKMTAP